MKQHPDIEECREAMHRIAGHKTYDKPNKLYCFADPVDRGDPVRSFWFGERPDPQNCKLFIDYHPDMEFFKKMEAFAFMVFRPHFTEHERAEGVFKIVRNDIRGPGSGVLYYRLDAWVKGERVADVWMPGAVFRRKKDAGGGEILVAETRVPSVLPKPAEHEKFFACIDNWLKAGIAQGSFSDLYVKPELLPSWTSEVPVGTEGNLMEGELKIQLERAGIDVPDAVVPDFDPDLPLGERWDEVP